MGRKVSADEFSPLRPAPAGAEHVAPAEYELYERPVERGTPVFEVSVSCNLHVMVDNDESYGGSLGFLTRKARFRSLAAAVTFVRAIEDEAAARAGQR